MAWEHDQSERHQARNLSKLELWVKNEMQLKKMQMNLSGEKWWDTIRKCSPGSQQEGQGSWWRWEEGHRLHTEDWNGLQELKEIKIMCVLLSKSSRNIKDPRRLHSAFPAGAQKTTVVTAVGAESSQDLETDLCQPQWLWTCLLDCSWLNDFLCKLHLKLTTSPWWSVLVRIRWIRMGGSWKL